MGFYFLEVGSVDFIFKNLESIVQETSHYIVCFFYGCFLFSIRFQQM